MAVVMMAVGAGIIVLSFAVGLVNLLSTQDARIVERKHGLSMIGLYLGFAVIVFGLAVYAFPIVQKFLAK